MLTTKEIALTLRKGHWTTSIDLSDAYLHIPIHTDFRKYLRFVHRGIVYQFKSLPFGLSDSPYVFTRVIKAMLKVAQSNGIQIGAYLDDWLNRGFSPSRVDFNHKWLELLCLNLGLLVNREKSEPIPTQKPVFVGILWDLVSGRMFPTQKRIEELISLAHQMLAYNGPLPATFWQRILGKMSFMEKQIPWSRLHMRPLQFCLRRNFDQSRQDPNKVKVPLDQESRWALIWWSNFVNLSGGKTLGETIAHLQLFTDASGKTGWGAWMGQLEDCGIWSQQLRSQHINYQELTAIWMGLQSFLPHIRDNVIQVYSDKIGRASCRERV
jgi:hypothetical protein